MDELEALRARLKLDLTPEIHGPTQVWRGEHADGELALALSGIGKVHAAAAATVLRSLFPPRALIFSGVAGGLHPELQVGTVLLADRLAIHDYGLMAGGGVTPPRQRALPPGA